MTWYYALNGQQVGPVSEQQLSGFVGSGVINAMTLVWREGMQGWLPLRVAVPFALGPAAADVPQLGGYALPQGKKDLIVQQIREGVTLGVHTDKVYGGFWARLVAKIIDIIILGVPQFGLDRLISQLLHFQGGIDPAGGGRHQMVATMEYLLWVFVASIVVGAIYSTVLVAKYGATWGKMAVGLRVVMENNAKISYGRALGRYFAEMVSSLTLGIGYLMVAFDAEKRSLHDHMCATRVISTL